MMEREREYVAERCRLEYEAPEPIQGPVDAVYQFLEMVNVAVEKREHFVALYLDSRLALLRADVVSIGSLNASLVHPREVFAPAIECRANGVIVLHNHPSGVATPSDEDRAITKRLVECGRMLGIQLLDHIVVGARGSWVSMQAERVL